MISEIIWGYHFGISKRTGREWTTLRGHSRVFGARNADMWRIINDGRVLSANNSDLSVVYPFLIIWGCVTASLQMFDDWDGSGEYVKHVIGHLHTEVFCRKFSSTLVFLSIIIIITTAIFPWLSDNFSLTRCSFVSTLWQLEDILHPCHTQTFNWKKTDAN